MAQRNECSFGCVARSGVLLKLNVANILLFNFCEQKFVQHGPITIAIDCNGLSLLIFEEKWHNYASGSKSTPKSDVFCFGCCGSLMYACGFSVPQMRQVWLVYIPAKIQMSFIWKDDFFFAKIGIFCKTICRNISQHGSSVCITIFARRKDKTNYLSNQIWAKCYHSRSKH